MDDDVSLPKATIQKMIKDCVPSEMRVAGDATDMFVACCTVRSLVYLCGQLAFKTNTADIKQYPCRPGFFEFIQLLSSEANEIAMKEHKNTIAPEHVMKALAELGFTDPEFVSEIQATWNSFKEDAKLTSSQKASLRKTGADQAGLTEAEQIALQQQMFAAARARSVSAIDNTSAVAAAYQAQLAALEQQGQQPPPAQAAVAAAPAEEEEAPPEPMHNEHLHPEAMHIASMLPEAMHHEHLHPESMHPGAMHIEAMLPEPMHHEHLHHDAMHIEPIHNEPMLPESMHHEPMHPDALHIEPMHPGAGE